MTYYLDHYIYHLNLWFTLTIFFFLVNFVVNPRKIDSASNWTWYCSFWISSIILNTSTCVAPTNTSNLRCQASTEFWVRGNTYLILSETDQSEGGNNGSDRITVSFLDVRLASSGIIVLNSSRAAGILLWGKNASAEIWRINKLKFSSVPYWMARPEDSTLWWIFFT